MITGLDFIWLPVADMARARAFYRDILGLPEGTAGGDNWCEFDLGDGPAIDLFVPNPEWESALGGSAASVGLAARDFAGMTNKLKAMDLQMMEPFETDVCHGGPSEDSEGNRFVVHQRKSEPTRDHLVDFIVVPVEDMARARAFYEGTLGLVMDSEGRGMWTEYVLSDDSALALFKNPGGFEAATGGGVGLQTDSLDETFAQLKALGMARADEVMDSPVCRMGFVRDSEGNALVLHRRK